jgi:hypothetical protein
MAELLVSFERRSAVIVARSAEGVAERPVGEDVARDGDVLYQQQHLGTTGIAGGQTFRDIVADVKDQLRAVGRWFHRNLVASHKSHA